MKQCENRIALNTKAQKVAEATPEPFKNVEYEPLKVPDTIIADNVVLNPREQKTKKIPLTNQIKLRTCSGRRFHSDEEFIEQVKKYFNKLAKEGQCIKILMFIW